MDDETFDDALLQLIRERSDRDPGIIVEYVILAATSNVNDEGEQVSWVGYVPGPNSVPYHRLMGLLEMGKLVITNDAIEEHL